MTDRELIVWGIGTSRTMRVHWMLQEFGLAYACRAIGSRTGETMTDAFAALNPRQKIPVLQAGAEVLTESAAIIGYIGDAYPPPADFFVPATALERARVNEWCHFVMSELDAHSLYVVRRHEGLQDLYGAAPVAVAAARTYFSKYVAAMAGQVQAGGRYLTGDKPSIADILFGTCLDWAEAYGIELPMELADYRQSLQQRPAYRRALDINYPEREAA